MDAVEPSALLVLEADEAVSVIAAVSEAVEEISAVDAVAAAALEVEEVAEAAVTLIRSQVPPFVEVDCCTNVVDVLSLSYVACF